MHIFDSFEKLPKSHNSKESGITSRLLAYLDSEVQPGKKLSRPNSDFTLGPLCSPRCGLQSSKVGLCLKKVRKRQFWEGVMGRIGLVWDRKICP